MQLPKRKVIFSCWFLSVAFIIYGTLIPFQFASTPQTIPETIRIFFEKLSLRPLPHISKMDILSNFLLFIPYGFLIPGLLLRGIFLPLFLSLISSFGLSLTLEIAQAYSPLHTSSPYDLILNTVGSVFGTFLGLFFFRLLYSSSFKRFLHLLHEKPILLVTLIYGLLLYIGGLFPFDISIQISDIKESIKTIQWIPFIQQPDDLFYFTKLWTDFLLFIPFACLCHISLRLYAFRLTLFFIPTTLLSISLAGLAEFSQLFIVSRQTDMTHLLLALFSGGIGSGIALGVEHFFLWREGFSGQDQATLSQYLIILLKLLAFLCYSLVTAYLLLSPLQFNFSLSEAKSHLGWGQLIPLYAYWVNTDFHAAQDLLFTLLLFVPLGAYLYFCLRNLPFPRTASLLLCFFFSFSIELLQFFQPGRCPDFTDVLTASSGAFVGIWLIHKLTSQK